MQEHCPGVYEIEFQRLYREQGHILYKLRHWHKQLSCYNAKYNDLCDRGIIENGLRTRMIKMIDKITDYEKQREMLESAKEEVSIKNNRNTMRAIDELIISNAYEQAYQSHR